ncbi:MAG: ATP-binding protein [Thermodesulfobacteria bacterium]|nr:ATP-binding protein [Thermodesulfobacteriota bacterium]
MPLPSWWEIATPHKDIREGFLDERVFAADLGDVLAGRAPAEYQDARLFFRRTYPTKGLKELLENVFSRLSGGPGDAVIQLQTPFGGGKTHALLALYHSANNPDLAAGFWGISEFPPQEINVAVFVGTKADPFGLTPWGEIAKQLGSYEVISEHDQKRVAPGKDRLNAILDKASPCLILMDELLEYVVKVGRTEEAYDAERGQLLAFLQELSEAVGSRKDAVLVVTLPSSALEQYDEKAERTLAKLQHVLGRVEAIYTPVEGVEIYEIIRKRLFEDLGSPTKHQEIAQEFYELYERLGSDVPTEARELSYREKIARAYPFHPELIDVLYERWGSFPRFQRTRGVLRLLAEVVKDLYEKQKPIPLIQSSQVNLERPKIKQELLKHLGIDFEGIINYDIAQRAPRIDKTMGSEYARFNMAQGLARAIFLYSFSASPRNGINLPKLRVASLYPGLPSAIVADALKKLEDELWFLHQEAGFYLFKKEPNLNRIIVEREEAVSEEEILARLKSEIQKICGQDLKPVIWPERPGDVPDVKALQLVVLSPKLAIGNGEEENVLSFVKEIFENAGQGFRTYRNALFVLLPDARRITKLLGEIRRVLTLEHLLEDKSLAGMLRKEDIGELKKRLREAKEGIPDSILLAYSKLAHLRPGGELKVYDLPMHIAGKKITLTARVREYLLENELVLREMSPKYLLQKTFAPDEDEKTFGEIYEVFLKTPGLALPLSEGVVREAVKNGVRAGYLGIRTGEKVLIGETISEMDLFPDTPVLKPEKARTEKIEAPFIRDRESSYASKGKPASPSVGSDRETTTDKITTAEPVRRKRKKVYFRAEIPWDQLSSVISGVVRPLKGENAEVKICLELSAISPSGIDPTTLETKIKETLQQIGAEIIDWEEE